MKTSCLHAILNNNNTVEVISQSMRVSLWNWFIERKRCFKKDDEITQHNYIMKGHICSFWKNAKKTCQDVIKEKCRKK